MPSLTFMFSGPGLSPPPLLEPSLAQLETGSKRPARAEPACGDLFEVPANVDSPGRPAYLAAHVAPSSKGKTTDSDSVN